MDGPGKAAIDATAHRTIGAAMEVANTLGTGFVEKVYERAVTIELARWELAVRAQPEISVYYKGHPVGTYVPDLLVGEVLLVELKCVDSLTDIHLAQCLNYLRATNLRLCLLMNFGRPKLQWRRVVHRL